MAQTFPTEPIGRLVYKRHNKPKTPHTFYLYSFFLCKLYMFLVAVFVSKQKEDSKTPHHPEMIVMFQTLVIPSSDLSLAIAFVKGLYFTYCFAIDFLRCICLSICISELHLNIRCMYEYHFMSLDFLQTLFRAVYWVVWIPP